jgi:hypothetical protein
MAQVYGVYAVYTLDALDARFKYFYKFPTYTIILPIQFSRINHHVSQL